MAGAPTQLLRLLPLLLLVLPSGLREYLSPEINHRPEEDGTAPDPGVAGDAVLHPIVLVPGVSCSKLEARLTGAYRPSVPRCGAMKGKGWFGLWDNCSDLPGHHYVHCFMEQMSLVYDPVADDYRNLPGVETRVPNFGSARGFQINPEHPDWCLQALRRELERIGYRDGDTLFGAPYDLRRAPPMPGQTSRAYSFYFRQLTRLIEDASRRNQGRKAILFGHSFGGTVALAFVQSTPMAWRDRYIKHLILAAAPPAAGVVPTVKYAASGPEVLYVPTAPPPSLRPMWRTFESAVVNFPSPAVFGRRPLVVTARRNYSAHDMAEFLAAAGFGAASVLAFRRREVTSMDRFQPPMVPTTCINGESNETLEQLVYWDGDFNARPVLVYGDGDGFINLVSMLAFDEQMRQQNEQNKLFKSIRLEGARHSTIVTDDWALKRIMQEILEANRISG
ncbi:hypothetical protein PAHAL_5G470700 [Panicum hallii]|uniref:AB hydrolase-1 domain-containing protein n=1 Tax=Panicum hallii TaxID=206008 RepID=A0A2S3HXP2_9POAL|nr:lecithin-cholesterol acyltransferase-like 1 [Panicum hallii]PAN32200.1 hypothetical protein PAHAL_5G470700 [Panicum hallii]